MSLIRQIWLLLLGTLLLAFLGSFGVWMASSKGYLETQLRLKNADNAQALALNLSQQRGDATAMELAAMAMFDTGHYERIALKDANGQLLFQQKADPAMSHKAVPEWFIKMNPVLSVPGIAQVSDGWRAMGSVEVVSHSSFAHTQLWDGAWRTAGWLALLGFASGALATLGVRGIRQPLDATVGQAQALMERRFITVQEPKVPELARLSAAMNAVVLRLKSLFDEQAGQVENLRRQAHCDPLTGLAHRGHFMTQFASMLQDEEGPAKGILYLLRVHDLLGLNARLGHQATDDLLKNLAGLLRHSLIDFKEAYVGRLNGGDFAVALAGVGEAQVAMASRLVAVWRDALDARQDGVTFVVGGATWSHGMTTAKVLAAADAALAKAESQGPFTVELGRMDDAASTLLGERAWRNLLSDAIDQERVKMVSYPVLDRQGKLVHQESPMRIQVAPQGDFDAAAIWLPMALRSGLIARIDELAVRKALAAVQQDGLPRCVNLSPASLLDSGFVPRLRALLMDAGAHAECLWLEVAESAAVERFELVRELCKQLRPLGARVGLEHAGEKLSQIEFLFETGLDYVKLDASVVQDVAIEPARAAFVQATVTMLHGIGLKVYGEGLNQVDDIHKLYECGIDGVTGPAVRP